MRLLLMVTIVLVLSGCGGWRARQVAKENEVQKPAPVEKYELLAAGQYGTAAQGQGAGRGVPFVLVARDAGEFERLWREHIGSNPLPVADLSQYRVLFLLLGRQNSGGHAVEFHSAERDGEILEIDATVRRPAPDSMTTQALTAPYAVVAVLDREFRRVEWKSRGEVIARTDLAD